MEQKALQSSKTWLKHDRKNRKSFFVFSEIGERFLGFSKTYVDDILRAGTESF